MMLLDLLQLYIAGKNRLDLLKQRDIISNFDLVFKRFEATMKNKLSSDDIFGIVKSIPEWNNIRSIESNIANLGPKLIERMGYLERAFSTLSERSPITRDLIKADGSIKEEKVIRPEIYELRLINNIVVYDYVSGLVKKVDLTRVKRDSKSLPSISSRWFALNEDELIKDLKNSLTLNHVGKITASQFLKHDSVVPSYSVESYAISPTLSNVIRGIKLVSEQHVISTDSGPINREFKVHKTFDFNGKCHIKLVGRGLVCNGMSISPTGELTLNRNGSKAVFNVRDRIVVELVAQEPINSVIALSPGMMFPVQITVNSHEKIGVFTISKFSLLSYPNKIAPCHHILMENGPATYMVL